MESTVFGVLRKFSIVSPLELDMGVIHVAVSFTDTCSYLYSVTTLDGRASSNGDHR